MENLDSRLIHNSLGSHGSAPLQNDISVGSSVFARHAVVTNTLQTDRQTDRQTDKIQSDHATQYVCSSRHAMQATRLNKTKFERFIVHCTILLPNCAP